MYRNFIICLFLVFTYGCSDSNNNDLFSAVGSNGGLGAVDLDAGTYPDIQVIQPFLSGAIDPIKVQYWDQTYYWGPDIDGNDACFKGTVGIQVSSNLAQETAPGAECPTSIGQVTPCNADATPGEPYKVASGAVQPAISNCEHDGAACTDILVSGITDEVTCEATVRQADPIAAGAAWFQNIDAPGTKGGTASHWWYGTRADKMFDAEDGYGGTQIDYISGDTNINIAARASGSGPTTRINNIHLCSNKDVVNPAKSPDVCTLSSLFGSCDGGAQEQCKINNIGLVDGAYNIFIRSATPSDGFGGEEPASSPGSDTLVWIYPEWTAPMGELSKIGKKAQTTYKPQLAAKGFQPVIGFALPVVSWKAARIDAPFCPYTDDKPNGYTYQSQMGRLRGDTSTRALVGLVDVGKGENWSSQTPQDLVACLKHFSSDIQGIAIDDEYNVLTSQQRAAIMNWCNGQFASKRCGFVVGHNSTKISYTGAMQNVCMAYSTGAEKNCGGSQARNIYNGTIPSKPLFNPALPFDIFN